MKITVGNSILTGAFIAFSSAASWRRRRMSCDCTRRMRDSEIPSWSAWTMARANWRHLGRVDALRQVLQGGRAALADPHLVQHQAELVDQRALHALVQLHQRLVEAEPGLHRHAQQVEHVGQLRAHPVLAAAHAVVDDEVGRDEPDRRTAHRRSGTRTSAPSRR